MRILWYSCAPWEPTGYGTQTGIWCQRLAAAGHEVAVSAYHGVQALEVVWNGIRVFPAPLFAAGPSLGSVLSSHVRKWEPDLVILLCDVWFHGGAFAQLEQFPDVKVAAWMPTDTDPISMGDIAFLRELEKRIGLKAIAMSEYGQQSMSRAGIDSVYVPHGIDTTTFAPLAPEARTELRAALGLGPDTFAVGWNFSNIDPFRKGQYEGMRAFSQFHVKHPDSVLFMHTITPMEGSKHLDLIAQAEGITGAIRLSDQTRMQEGSFTAEEMATWYGVMDVAMNASLGEGFGICAIEAQACGTPVILSRGTTGAELVGPSRWLAATEPWWNDRHAARWHRPQIWSLEEKLKMALGKKDDQRLRDQCRTFAEGYDVEAVWPYWEEALPALMQ